MIVTLIPPIDIECAQCHKTFQYRALDAYVPKYCLTCNKAFKKYVPSKRTHKGPIIVTSPNGIECLIVGGNTKPLITVRIGSEFCQMQCEARPDAEPSAS